MTKSCTIDGCSRPIRARGWCDKHWQRWWNHGDPTFIKTGRGLTLEERFWRFVTKTNDCWLWIGRNNARGYGMFNSGHQSHLAHRFAYELTSGPVPEGLDLDHTCEVKACVNPAHLEPVTHAENMRRVSQRRAQRRTDLAAARARISELERQLRMALDALAHRDPPSVNASKAGTRKG